MVEVGPWGGRKSRLLASTSNTSNIDEVEEEKRREIHRQNERQRRQKMATLFESLRSVIPNDHLKGRKTIIDHLEEATNYIKDLEKNIKELKEKRDELKQSTEPTSSSRDQLGASSDPTRPNSVVISQIVGGFDIEIRAKDDEYMLSTAIQVAFEEGLHVVSSTSSKLHGRFIHSIQCEVSDVTCVDLKRLEQRLNDLFR
ncbi:transcription factor bHLH120-like [Silene latifolia]|uniref:transcription factor bHLH120-like n=1 Tax=Silene latifolia TaxID=37657 RepID=UPI003D76F3D2